MIQSKREVACMVGASFSTLKPGASAANNETFFEPLATDGRKAKVNTTTPKPPIHCVMLRQKRMPCGCWSISLRMVAPVVEKPDMVSKKASVTLSTVPFIRKGNIPNNEKSTHDKATTIKVSRIFSVPRLLMLPIL